MPAPVSITIWRLVPETLQAFAQLPTASLAYSKALLSIEEQRRAAAFHAEEDRRLYLAAHAALRLVLNRLLGLPPASIEITAENGAKPALPNSPLRFNLAHTRRAVLIATSTTEVGIDIERRRPIEDLAAVAQTIMSRTELSAWLGLPSSAREQAFYRLWTRKEAYLKAIGLGLFRDLAAITVPLADLKQPALVEDRGETLPHAHWRLCDLPVWEDYSAALCWQAAAPPHTSQSHDHPPILPTYDISLAELTSASLS